MSKLVSHVESCLKNTDKYISKLNEDILNMEGKSGKKNRHLYNNLCEFDKTKYLEIGSWKGSLVCSSLYNNKLSCLCIDNWSQFGGPKEEFLVNFNKYKANNNAEFLERDCWNIDTSCIGRFNIYSYDGVYGYQYNYDALYKYYNALDDQFIFLVNNWNDEEVKNGTYKSIEDLKINILFSKLIETSNEIDNNDWSNGVGIFVLEKEKLDLHLYEPSDNDVSNYL
mgnify:CR=1 FL=1|jgi:hypothetical protein